ncbi:Doublecortin [Ancylostoma ceylanicum]|uniref:Doublecortin n=1 Tax=Ancylostoma ceylanicum TaxID=53326 RepID=A0A0D6M6B8_9BILA|nr:Doublecortin [Ancylostoma ceylanicum]
MDGGAVMNEYSYESIPPTPRQSRDLDDDLATPRASSFDVRSEGDQLQTASMTSSIVVESRDSSNNSPTESRIDVNPPDVITTPKPFRCVTRSAKAKRIRFYRNGDQYYKGLWYALRSDRVRSMKPLMEDLAKTMGDSTALPLGVRHIFSIDGQTRITDIEQFEDGESYVCSRSFDQVMTDLTCVVKLDSGAIRKLFALGGTAMPHVAL